MEPSWIHLLLFLLIAEALLLLVSIKQVKTRLLPILHRLTHAQNIEEDLRELFERYPETFLQWELTKTIETVIEIRRARDAALLRLTITWMSAMALPAVPGLVVY
tara:strand:- start:537 stop:851 length:315 start_codon:yes stop_codon:yes gene_type:complete